MCEPTTIIAVTGLILTAAAGVQTARAQRAAGEAAEEQSAENAKAANAQARNTELSGQVEEDRRRQQTRQLLASQRTTFAANNLDMSVGTPMEILGDTAAIGEQDALTIRANAAREAWGYRAEANNYLNQGRAANAAGKNQAMGTYLTTAASMTNQAAGMAGSGRAGAAPRYTTTNRGPSYSTYAYSGGARYS